MNTSIPERGAGNGRRGAYGFRLRGLPQAAPLLLDAPSHWPELELRTQVVADRTDAFAQEFGDERARLTLRTGGSVEFDRAAGRVTFILREPVPDAAIVHPLLGVAAVVPAYWLGRESFHAGAVCLDGRVWAVIGAREAGKSTLIASLALAGIPIVADDILVLDGRTALAGPRSVDLREPAARALAAGEPLGRVGDRDRWRLALGPVTAELPLRGWITLRWGEQIALEPLRGADRLRRIAPQRAFLLRAADPAALIGLSSLPVLEFTRPRRITEATASAAALLELLGRAQLC